ncbi:MAG: hypothetical protein WCA56_20245, partial [Xanthobacteraceae bacterium]
AAKERAMDDDLIESWLVRVERLEAVPGPRRDDEIRLAIEKDLDGIARGNVAPGMTSEQSVTACRDLARTKVSERVNFCETTGKIRFYARVIALLDRRPTD